MGANSSKTINTIINKTITDQSMTIINSKKMKIEKDYKSVQEIRNSGMKAGRNIIGCTNENNQNIAVTDKTYSKIDDDTKKDIQRYVEEYLTNTAKSEIEQAISGLPLATANISNAEQYVENYSFHDLSTVFTNNLENLYNQRIEASQLIEGSGQEAGDDIDCTIGGGNFNTQNISLELVLESTLKSKEVTNIVNDFTKTVDNILEAKTTQKIAGLDPFAFFGMIAGAIILLVGAGFLFMFLKFK